MRMSSVVALLVLTCAVAAAGCRNAGPVRPERLDGQAIMPGRGRLPTEPYSPVDQPGQLPYDDARRQREQDPSEKRGAADTSDGDKRVLDRAMPPPAKPFDPSSAPATAPSEAVAPGGFMTIGGVVAEVNSVPIYADKIVSDLESDLAAKASDLSEARFREYAANELRKQVTVNIEAEILFAAANRLLDERDKEQARWMAEHWRQQEIIKAGGSIETARRRYAEHGRDFDKQVVEEYRVGLSRLLLQKRIIPQIQVTAAEMRDYYEANRETEFTVRASAQFDMIQIDPAKVGGGELAKQKIEDLRERAVAGEDFTSLTKFSTGPRLRNSQGELPWIDRKAFALPAVEEAVWELQPGEVTPVIEEGGRFYIARLERKRPARVRPFEEEATQDEIREKLRTQKFQPRYRAMIQELRDQSIVRTDPAMMETAMEVAMQRYRQWAAK
ncbi:MAG TPA: peptidyl-prolyl cis-trans isomerase [Tepidisphaeraceae bacterium]|nr:peptidyl-prolyl cis-trans isomerase [Tepidisphaeraceae bacterium]